MVSANSLMQQSASYLLGFTGGIDDFDLGYLAMTPPWNAVNLWHRPGDFLVIDRVPKIAISSIFCSRRWDWNLPNDEGFQRSLLASQDYVVASMWNSGSQWYYESLALGETIGVAQLHNVQKHTGIRTDHSGVIIWPDPEQDMLHSDQTYLAALGDPTLRLDYLLPPKSPSLNGTTLSWQASDEPNVQYLAYYKDGTGSYVRAQNSSQPVGCCSVNLTSTEAQSTSFRVRATKTITSGHGSYQGLSQGAFYPPL